MWDIVNKHDIMRRTETVVKVNGFELCCHGSNYDYMVDQNISLITLYEYNPQVQFQSVIDTTRAERVDTILASFFSLFGAVVLHSYVLNSTYEYIYLDIVLYIDIVYLNPIQTATGSIPTQKK